MIELGRTRFADSGIQVHYLHGHANIGYGAAHNLVLHGTGADYQLVLNPDVELAPDALANAVRWLDAHADVGALAPAVTNARRRARVPVQALSGGVRSAAARLRAGLRAPAVPPAARSLRAARPSSIPPATSRCSTCRCCRARACWCKREPIDVTGGFDPRFFLYFEDFDWSVRLARVTRTA